MIGRPPLDKNTDLFQEIETLSRALSLPTSFKSKLKSTPCSSSQKKPSFWNWKPLKALAHIRQRRFDCIFYLHVHSIKNLPPALGDAALSVYWKRTSDPSSAAGTSSVRAFDGVAEFEETLTYRCSVYGGRKGSSHSAAKYEARQFLIYVSFTDASEADLGKHMVDVTRLLPHTLEELEDQENRSGKWSTSFRLSGKGKGASLNVSFGFLLIDDGTVADTLTLKMHDDGSAGRVADKGGRRLARYQPMEDVRVLHEILPCLKSSASSLADTVEKSEIHNCDFREMCDLQVGSTPEFYDLCVHEEFKPRFQAWAEHFEGCCLKEPEFLKIEQGVEISAKDQVSGHVFENIDVEFLDQSNQVVSKWVEESFDDITEYKESRLFSDDNQTTMEDQDLVCDVLSLSEPDGLEALNCEFRTPFPKTHTGVKSEYEDGSVQNNSFGFDDSIEAIASEFLDMLSIDPDPFGLSSDSEVESPREQLWKNFEEETLGAGSLLFGLDIETELDDELSNEDNLLHEFEDFDLSFMVHEAQRELYKATQGLCHYSRYKLLDNAEAEVLMRKQGLNENAFQCSPGSNNGFDIPVDLSSELPVKLPPLGEGLGPFVLTKDSGFLRCMSPDLFRISKCNASLIMQASRSVVVPSEMCSGDMEILHRLESVGIEKLSTLAMKLIPFEDVGGRTMQQIAWEATSAMDACKRPDELPDLNKVDVVIPQKASGRRKKEKNLNLASSSASDRDSKCISVEDLAPLTMEKIDTLPIQGLRIQSSISDLGPQFFGNVPALDGKGFANDRMLGQEGTAGIQLLDVKGNADDVDGLMCLSITLDEWMRLYSGIVIDGDQTMDKTSKILAAHQAAPSNLIAIGWKQEKTRGKSSGRSWGLQRSNFTVALMLQLRDTLRSYDPVGIPKLALLQAEHVFLPGKFRIDATVSEKGNSEEDETELKPMTKSEPILVNGEKVEEEGIPQFKFTEVLVTSLATEPNRKNVAGNSVQHQSGWRWLIANGMGKSNKHPFMKSKPVSNPGNALWSISSQVHRTGSKWKEKLAMHTHFRNPNVGFPRRP